MFNLVKRPTVRPIRQVTKLFTLTVLAIAILSFPRWDYANADDAASTPPFNHPGDDALAASAAGATCANDAVAKRIAWLNEDDDQARAAIEALYVRVGKIENELQSISLKYENIGMSDDYIRRVPRVAELNAQDSVLDKAIELLKKRRTADQAELDVLSAKPPCVEHNAVPAAGGTNTVPLPPPPVIPPPPPAGSPTKPISAICQHCAWLRTQIQDIDDKIAGWQRQDASIRKNSNLSDPKIQSALKDIADKIAGLRNKQAQLRAELAECEKKCLPPPQTLAPPSPAPSETVQPSQVPPPKKPVVPIPPPATDHVGGSTPETPVCPPSGGSGALVPPGPSGRQTLVFLHEKHSQPPLGPTRSAELEAWESTLRAIDAAESDDGDDEDISDAVRELSDMIEFEEEEVQDDRYNDAAAARLTWLRKQYEHFKAWDEFEEARHPRLRAYQDCPHTTTPPADKKDGSHSSVIDDVLGHTTFGFGFGIGGHHSDKHDHPGSSDTPPKETP